MSLHTHKRIKGKKYLLFTRVKGSIGNARQVERDIYGSFSKRIVIHFDKNFSQVRKSSSVDLRMKKNKALGGFDIYATPRKNRHPIVHPVIMQRRW